MSGAGSGSPRGTGVAGDWVRIAASMTVTCALGAAVLGGVYLATERYAEEARVRGERRAVTELLGLGPDASVLEVRQYLTPDRNRVVYRSGLDGAGPGLELLFSLDGSLVSKRRLGRNEDGLEAERNLSSLGRLFVASHEGRPAGFVLEGESRGYKNRIRFFVGVSPSWEIAGVRVVEHEEDPGLGAEVASPWFQGQYAGRPWESVQELTVTRDPMPEDWRSALRELRRGASADWNERHRSLRTRERERPIYAVTGATISSRALTDGVRATILRFRRRWELIEPFLKEGA